MNFEVNEESPQKNAKQGSFWSKVNDLKKWGEGMLGSKKTKIYLRKYLCLERELEIKACEENPQRYPILIEEVFYRFKHEFLILNPKALKKLCALYYILTNVDRIHLLNEGNFQVEKLKMIIPDSKWKSYIDMSYF